MADKEVADLTSAGTLDGTESFHLVKGGNSRKSLVSAVLTYVLSGFGAFGLSFGTNTDAQGARADLGLEDASTDNALVRFNGTDGETQNSGVIVDDSNNVSGLGTVSMGDALTVTEHATAPATPASGKAVIYAKADGLIYAKDDAGAEAPLSPTAALTPYGKQGVYIPAAAMKARTTNGAASGSAEMTTNKNMFVTLDFDASTQEFAQFAWRMPPSWNEGTITFSPVWSHPSTTTNFGVVWSLAAVAISNDDAGDVAFGTEQTSSDTGGTTNDIYEGPESSAITVAGSPAAGDFVMFQIARVPANGSDTMAVDARLHGIMLWITTNTGNDA